MKLLYFLEETISLQKTSWVRSCEYLRKLENNCPIYIAFGNDSSNNCLSTINTFSDLAAESLR
jgi:hypothetical protein